MSLVWVAVWTLSIVTLGTGLGILIGLWVGRKEWYDQTAEGLADTDENDNTN